MIEMSDKDADILTMSCPACDGKGELYDPHVSLPATVCEVCDGKGRVSFESAIRTLYRYVARHNDEELSREGAEELFCQKLDACMEELDHVRQQADKIER